jgi:Family of unknown function (DUF5317)
MIWILCLPFLVGGLGTISNQAVLIANHDKFPVLVDEYKRARNSGKDGMIDDTHCIMTKDTHLNALGDIFDMRNEGTTSIGDILIDLGDWLKGICWWVWLALYIPRRERG